MPKKRMKTVRFVNLGGVIVLLSTMVFNKHSGGDVQNFEPTYSGRRRRKTRLKFKDPDKIIQELRAIYKVHPEWFEVPKPKSGRG